MTRGDDTLRGTIVRAAHRDILMAHGEREPVRAALRHQRVGERYGLEHGDEVVIAVRAPRPGREHQVEFGASLDGDTRGARHTRGRHRRAPDRGPCCARARGAAHWARYRIHTAISRNSATAAWIGRSESSTCEGSSLVSETRTRCR